MRSDNMEVMSNTTNINIRIDAKLKKESDTLFKELGLNMSTAINMFLTKCVSTASIPFKIEKYNPKKELLEALEEGEQIIKDLKNGQRKGYSNMDDLTNSLNDE